MNRDEVWTVSGAGSSGNPRPAVIVPDNRFDATASVTVCVFTTEPSEAPLFRPPITPSERNGIRVASRPRVSRFRAGLSPPQSAAG